MRRPEPDSPEAARRAENAAAWLVKRDRGLTPQEQDEFLQWLAADPRHGVWFALQRRAVGDFGRLTQWRPEHSGEPNPDLLARPRHRVRRFLPLALAAAACLAMAVTWRQVARSGPDHHDGQTADYQRRILEDGSTVELHRDAVVRVAFTAGERRVTLERGEALFTVTKHSARPFIVSAAGIEVRAVGTAFNVRLDAAAVEVLVTEGRVHVQPTSPASAAAGPASAEAPPPLVEAGQRAIVSLASPASPQISTVSAEETARLLSWYPQLLDFSSVPLGRAIAEFNRRNRVQFVLADPDLAAMTIVASIRSDNIEGFAQFLSATPGVQVERRSATEIVLRRKQ